MTERGRYVMTRGWQDHPVFKDEPYAEREAWEWLIAQAAYEDTRARVNRTVFEVKRGQLVHAYRFMAQKWKWSEARVRRFLERLRVATMVDVQPSSESTRITICNYDEYQYGRRAGDAPATHRRRREEEPEEDKNLGGGTDARAREACPISREALAFADELAVIAGHDPAKLESARWFDAQPGIRVQLMLNAGWKVDVMRRAATTVMHNKRDGPPSTIRYFEKIFARAHAPQLPLPVAQVVKTEGQNAETVHRSAGGNWQSRRDAQHDARAELRAFVEGANAPTDSGGSSGGPPLRVVSDAGRG